MNEAFNLKRFLQLECYKRNETGKHLLWSTIIVLSIHALCILYDINRGDSYSDAHTSAVQLHQYIIWFIIAAPCLLETPLNKRTSTIYMLLPVSVFEKFLHIWIKYLLILPIYCALLTCCIAGLFSLSGNDFLQLFAAHIIPHEIPKQQILPMAILHFSAFIGYVYFRKQILLKSFGIFIATIACCMGITLIIISFMPDNETPGNYWVNNIVSWPDTNYPLSATAQFIINLCNYAAPICLLFGSWISCYFLLKEKQV